MVYSVTRFIIELHLSFYAIKHLVCAFYWNSSMDCYYRLQFHRRLLERQMPMVPKLSLPVCDVRDVAAAHIAAMTSPKAPGKSVKQFFRKINRWLLSRHLGVLMTEPGIINFPMLTLQTRTACGFSIIFHSRQAILFCKSQSLKLHPFWTCEILAVWYLSSTW